MHGLRHAPGSCHVEVSLGMVMLALVVIGISGLAAGMEFPRKGQNPVAKVIQLETMDTFFFNNNRFTSPVLQSGTGFLFLCSVNRQNLECDEQLLRDRTAGGI